MNLLTGIAMLILAWVMAVRYRPKSQSGRALLGITGTMGLLSLLAGTGSWKFQIIQFILQAIVVYCCFAQLRREDLLRRRRRMRWHPHRANVLQRGEKTCA